MENRSQESENPHETVILVFNEERFEVKKQNLIDKSQYFAARLSGNYRDHLQTELVIDFDIPLISLQDFIDWISNDDENDISAKMINYNTKEFDCILDLLKLSCIFVADNLENIVTDWLENNISPKHAIDIWLLSQELNINTLRDCSLAVCLDRFDELPLTSIYELSKENLLKLIGNINIRSSTSYLSDIAQKWMKHHDDFTIPLDIIKNKETKILHSVISYDRTLKSDEINSEQFIYCWDGKEFFELTSFKYPKNIIDASTGKNALKGMQIICRRYDLYLCGGEFGIGSGKFNTYVWRYSLISKKWYLETVMPTKRRHMIAAFVKNKLVLMGGVGQYREKLDSVDIYDIYTGEWVLECTKIPRQFVSVPQHFVFDEKVIVYIFDMTLYIYSPDKNAWDMELDFITQLNNGLITCRAMPCYFDINYNENDYKGTLILKIVTEVYNKEDNLKTDCSLPICYNGICPCHKAHIIHQNHFDMIYIHKRIDPYKMSLNPILLCTSFKTKPEMIQFQDIPIQECHQNKILSCYTDVRYNHLMHPAQLHTTNLDHA